ncbi:MAG TPA: GNAT family N-acetyltransferase [Thermoleophilaceae bacterium]|jgi:GNAT superfamily N-acetyltransferase
MGPALPPQRLAVAADVPRIGALMRAAILDLFPAFYDERQVASGARYIAEPDLTLIEDGTYYVHETGGEIVACGGWSKRDKLYTGSGEAGGDARLLVPATEPARVRAMFVRSDWTRRGIGRAILDACERDARAAGFRRLALMATLPGEQLYRACGFRETDRVMIPMPDGVELAGVAMEREITAGGRV